MPCTKGVKNQMVKFDLRERRKENVKKTDTHEAFALRSSAPTFGRSREQRLDLLPLRVGQIRRLSRRLAAISAIRPRRSRVHLPSLNHPEPSRRNFLKRARKPLATL